MVRMAWRRFGRDGEHIGSATSKTLKLFKSNLKIYILNKKN